MDGSSQESYSSYRANGDFNRVIENIKKLNNVRKYYIHNKLPVLSWAYVILPGTDSIQEIRRAKEMAAELGMTISFKRDWCGYIPKNADEIEKETGLVFAGADVKNLSLSSRNFMRKTLCLELWFMPQINWNGELLGCCTNWRKGFGVNVFDKGLRAALNSETVRQTKKMLMGGGGVCQDSPCLLCPFYHRMKNADDFISKKDITQNPHHR